jgi:hypothetical protein
VTITEDLLLDEANCCRSGERASGWLVFDVPARHGQLVPRDLDAHTVERLFEMGDAARARRPRHCPRADRTSNHSWQAQGLDT